MSEMTDDRLAELRDRVIRTVGLGWSDAEELIREVDRLRAATVSAGRPTPTDSGTYGELPATVRALIAGHEWDNMTRDEQRAWLIASLVSAGRLREALDKATTRLGILRDRMEACDAERDADDEQAGRHNLSMIEIPHWIAEQNAALSAEEG